ncbi:hypothetical protein PAXINDRAFT_171759 [Paxillus involutus ATCC 200175]|uniref:Uncharacterized protein n=1 Tax=Paxillus involutus ATCC 200175 TaxID=664439 RepID=A0A0C9SSU1_PAXIN|nr:hypothetical protein PAXINDRAFT_171759 [Paxillus involutus ATCC 200175]
MEQEPSPSFQQSQLYVPPNPVFVRDREINIWKLACQERVDCLLRRYGPDYIKALVQSEARSLFKDTRSSASSYADQVAAASEFNASLPSTPSPTKFRLYTPASYTYTSNSWGSGSGLASGRKEFPVDGDGEDGEAGWAMDDGEWGDGDVDMEDDDEDDYEDDDDIGEVDGEGEGELSLGAVEGLRIGDAAFGVVEDKAKVDARVNASMDVDEQIAAKQTQGPRTAVQGLPGAPPTEATLACEVPMPSAPTVSHPDSSPRPLPIRNPYTPPPPPTHLQRPSLPPLSSLHVPLLSEPPRAFMGRGTPPDRRRLVEWSGFGRLGSHRLGMGPPLYLSPVPQRHTNADVGVDVGIVPMSVDAPMHPPTPLPEHAHQGEWTSFLYAMLEGDGVGVGVSVGGASQGSEPGWYELGLGSVPATLPSNDLGIPLSHSHSPAPAVEHTVDEGNSSSTLRFALG